ncbi:MULTISPECIES: DUF1934 domain-containing protein [Aerococcus]|uniref:DUF1934 domain-containing protein n=1 Tax=Aerococcus TaxID=1375 RepID=UPI000DCF3380|nr:MULTISPECIES: DUF1934 domain-containing protein [Aerococcus]KAA9219525.1 DUF1934 domain-containing protein [Aerococcus loyolae]KAA9266544.1 DUF1934 domain-containing protein [Aerococcus loyolae]MDK6231372.1 DUF1934 domain-containing protein [Aerococcus urinae]MDK6258578.1 DUF1934 domain-containing protein [Aerococcus urinae]MDK6293824.1 DUF1934 domain-containing protein [Aerococcus urinae]
MSRMKETIHIRGVNHIQQAGEKQELIIDQKGTYFAHPHAFFIEYEEDFQGAKSRVRLKFDHKQGLTIKRSGHSVQATIPLELGKRQSFPYRIKGLPNLSLSSELDQIEVEEFEEGGRINCHYRIFEDLDQELGQYQLQLKYTYDVV